LQILLAYTFDENGEHLNAVMASYTTEYLSDEVSSGTFFLRRWNTPKDIYDTRAELQEDTLLNKFSFFAPVFSLSADQKLLASWNGIDSIFIQRVSDGEIIQRIFTNGTIETLGLSQKGELIAFTDSDGYLAVYDVSTMSEILSLANFGWSVKSITFSRDLKLIALAGYDLTIMQKSPDFGAFFVD
jgi:WD40 repeat protein